MLFWNSLIRKNTDGQMFVFGNEMMINSVNNSPEMVEWMLCPY